MGATGNRVHLEAPLEGIVAEQQQPANHVPGECFGASASSSLSAVGAIERNRLFFFEKQSASET